MYILYIVCSNKFSFIMLKFLQRRGFYDSYIA